ncbi:hypothetical protein D3C80_1536990 [compost metagenome]
MAVLVPDNLDILLPAATDSAVVEYFIKLLLPYNSGCAHSGQLRDGVACQLAGLLVAVDDVTAKIQ